MKDINSISVHRLREALGPEAILPLRHVLAVLEGNDYHKVYALLLTPEQLQRIVEAVDKRGV